MVRALLDSEIRKWVFLPIMLISFLVGIVKHYIGILLKSDIKENAQSTQCKQLIRRSQLLRENGKYLPAKSFLMRKKFIKESLDKNTKTQDTPTIFTNPEIIMEQMKQNFSSSLPTILLGFVVDWFFKGFVVTKILKITSTSWKRYFKLTMDISSENNTNT
ncbi:hypothetical protein LAZ67_11003601 [Cordylochernes scorpioides]|uniref:ER membrane protein complex subunit 3 n=1 Tax=Cordylochernes scorpioides TaxID=51811 RepID=A0ABY6KZY1_9ARAC|nr:hypothetical protein LAZ67_11003601 [Cordylochernes scorpioides]